MTDTIEISCPADLAKIRNKNPCSDIITDMDQVKEYQRIQFCEDCDEKYTTMFDKINESIKSLIYRRIL